MPSATDGDDRRWPGDKVVPGLAARRGDVLVRSENPVRQPVVDLLFETPVAETIWPARVRQHTNRPDLSTQAIWSQRGNASCRQAVAHIGEIAANTKVQ